MQAGLRTMSMARCLSGDSMEKLRPVMLLARHILVEGEHADLAADRFCRQLVVASDHDDLHNNVCWRRRPGSGRREL